MKFDIKTIEAITNTEMMKSVLLELANELADVKSQAVVVSDPAEAKAVVAKARQDAVRKFMNSAPAKANLGTFVKQLDLTTNSDAIEQELGKEIIELAIANSTFLNEIGSQTVSSTDFRQLVLNVRPTISQTGEQDGVTTAAGVTGTQTYKEVNALFTKIHAMPVMTHELLLDAHINVEAELMRLISEEWTFKLIELLLNGDGTKADGIQNLRGLLNARLDKANAYAEALKVDGVRNPDTFQVLKTGVDGSFGADAEATQDYFIDLQASLPQKFQANAKWYMSLKTFSTVKKIRTADGFPVIEFGKFAVSGAAWDEGYVMLGRPIVIIDQMPNQAVGATPVIYGDLKSAFKLVPLAGSDHFIVDEITTKGAKTVYLDHRFGEIVGASDSIRVALQAA
jgi:HK97 family phage major capsid protein